jgi:low affinity Fe/Cu permease
VKLQNQQNKTIAVMDAYLDKKLRKIKKASAPNTRFYWSRVKELGRKRT